MKTRTLLILMMSIVIFEMNIVAQDLSTFEMDAEIVDHILVDAELSATLDNQNRTHIAWIRHMEDSEGKLQRTLMYSVFDGTNSSTTEVYYNGLNSALMAPSIIVDQNDNPHIVFSLKRDEDYSVSNVGNAAVMYAGDTDGDGTFEHSQVSTNPDYPSDNDTEGLFNSAAAGSMRPQITIENSNILIGYAADSNSETDFDDYYIFARKNGENWDLTQEYILDDLTDFGPSMDWGMSFPENMSQDYHHGWGDDDPFFMVKSGSGWLENKIQGFEGVGMDNRNATFETGPDGKVHYTWFSEANDKDEFVYAVLEGQQINEIRSIEVQNNPSGHHRYSAVDIENGKMAGWYSRSFSSRSYLIFEDENGNVMEYEFEDIGEGFGRKVLNYKNNFISLVTASESNKSIYITRGNINETSTDNDPPISPENLTAEMINETVELNWDPNSEEDLSGYNIYRSDNSFINRTEADKINPNLITENSYTDTELSTGTYYYAVTAVDHNNNESDISVVVDINYQGGSSITLLYEDFDDGGFPPEGWERVVTNQDYFWFLGATQDWGFDEIDPNDDGSAAVPWIDQDQDEWMISSEIDLSSVNDPKLSFYVLHGTSYLNYAVMKLNVSTDADHQSWTELWRTEDDGGGFYWRKIEIDLSGYTDESTVKLGWQYVGNNGNDMAIDSIYVFGEDQTSTSSEEESQFPSEISLSPNYPNPFNPSTQIAFSLPEANNVTLKVYDMLGREVTTLVNGRKPAGRHQVTFDATALSSGMYVYRFEAGSYVQTRKMLLIK